MKAEFEFDGDSLRIFIKVDDQCEIALAKIIEKYNRAHVSLYYGNQDFRYGYQRDESPKGVKIVLKESPKCPANGQACARGCTFNDGGTGCELVPACEPGKGELGRG